MARAEILIEDAEDGTLSVKFRFMGEVFDPESKAHQLCNILRNHCDNTLSVFPDPPPEPEHAHLEAA